MATCIASQPPSDQPQKTRLLTSALKKGAIMPIIFWAAELK